MLIQSRPQTAPQIRSGQPAPPQKPQDGGEPPKDNFEPSLGSSLVRVAKFAVPAALGVYAGLGSGWGAAVAGALAITPACAALGAIGGGLLGEQVFGTTEASTMGALLAGGLVGGAAGNAGGALAGYAGGSPAMAVGLGLLGATTGLLRAATYNPTPEG